MSKRRMVSIAGAVTAMALVVAQPAMAGTEVGNPCTGNTSVPNFTAISEANGAGSPFPATVPSGGVITHWTFTVGPIPPNVLTQTLKVFRPTGVAKQFQVVGESAPGSMVTGANSFDTRIPVQAGDHLGYSGFAEGEVLTVYCITGNPGDRMSVVPGNPPNGTTAAVVEEGTGLQIPLVAKIEPDADGDGYGDETQDACPQSAAVQTACPVIVLDSFALPKKGRAVVLVATSTETPVTVSAFAKLPKTKKARASATIKLRKVKRTVKPGEFSRFVLKFPGSLRRALKSLPKGKRLTLKIAASARSVAGQTFKDKTKLRLKGQR